MLCSNIHFSPILGPNHDLLTVYCFFVNKCTEKIVCEND